VLDRLGGYDESFLRAQDWELNHRIRAAAAWCGSRRGSDFPGRGRRCARWPGVPRLRTMAAGGDAGARGHRQPTLPGAAGSGGGVTVGTVIRAGRVAPGAAGFRRVTPQVCSSAPAIAGRGLPPRLRPGCRWCSPPCRCRASASSVPRAAIGTSFSTSASTPAAARHLAGPVRHQASTSSPASCARSRRCPGAGRAAGPEARPVGLAG
jgi:hypothetical protein